MNVSSSAASEGVLIRTEPMDIGKIISTAWRLYRRNFKVFMVRSLCGSGWLLLPVAVLLAGVLWLLHAGLAVADVAGALGLLIPAWLVLFLWCNAQSLGELAAISRLTYRCLKTPSGLVVESMPEALRFTRSRRFSLLAAAVIRWLILGLISSIQVVAILFAIGMIFVGLGLATGQPSSRLFLLGGALFLGALTILGGLLIWLSVRFLVTEQALVIEKESGAIASIGRSWRLMKKNTLRALGMVILTGLICLPIVMVMAAFSQRIQFVVLQSFDAVPSLDAPQAVLFLALVASMIISTLVGIVGSIIVNPFFRAVVTTLYFDIRNQKESIEAS